MSKELEAMSREEIVDKFIKELESKKPILSELGYKMQINRNIEGKEIKVTFSIIIAGTEYRLFRKFHYESINYHDNMFFYPLANIEIIDMIREITKKIFY